MRYSLSDISSITYIFFMFLWFKKKKKTTDSNLGERVYSAPSSKLQFNVVVDCISMTQCLVLMFSLVHPAFHAFKTRIIWIMLTTLSSSATSWGCSPALLGHRCISLLVKNSEHFKILLTINISHLRGWSDGLVVRVLADFPEDLS